MSNFYRFYGDAPRTRKEPHESVKEWIAREREQKEFIGQELSEKEEENLRQLADNEE